MKELIPVLKTLCGANTVPFGLIHFVTDACNLKCDHCFIYGKFSRDGHAARYHARTLSLQEIDALTRSMNKQLLVASLTGGEQFLRQDLLEISKLYVHNAGAQLVEVATNGWFTDRLLPFVHEFLSGTNAHLYISLSFDGLRETHDRIRNVPGAFDRAVASAKKLLSLHEDRLTVGGTITVSNQTNEELEALFLFLTKDIHINSISSSALRGSPREEGQVRFNKSGYCRLNDLIRDQVLAKSLSLFARRFGRDLLNARGIVARDLVEKMVMEDRFMTPCTAGRSLVVIHSDGCVYPCEMLDQKMGSLRDCGMDLPALMCSKEAKTTRKQIRATRCFCTFECAYHYNVLFEPANWPALIAKYAEIKCRGAFRRRNHSD